MLERVKAYIKQNHIFLYLVLGALTTAVNYAVYFPLYNICSLSAGVSNVVAWAAAVIVAFITNKPLVYKSTDWSARVAVHEFIKFVGCRLVSGLIETVFVFVTVDLLLLNGNLLKLIISIFVVIFNYFTGKLLVFRHK